LTKYGKRTRLAIAGVLITLIVATGIAMASQKPTLVNSGTVHITNHGGSTSPTALVDSRSHAIYMSTHDSKTKSACTGDCKLNFKALTTAAHSKAEGDVNQKLLGRIKVKRGRYQVTYNHHLLYTATGDTTPSVALFNGCKGFKGYWYILNTKGHAIRPKGVVCRAY
jgi:predicted lipoprotein with Yx(FWY)xxD motif